MKIILLVGSFIILCLSSYCICARIKNFQKLKTREQTKNLWQEGEQPNYEKGKKVKIECMKDIGSYHFLKWSTHRKTPWRCC